MAKYPAYAEYVDTPADWLASLPAHWNALRLGQYFEERREKVSDADFSPLSVTMQGIVPQIATAAKTEAGDNRKKVCVGDFVINSRSDRKGSSGVSPHEGSVSLISIVLKPREIDSSFVHHLLRSRPFQEEFYRYGKGIVADLWSTNYSEMKNIVIPIPPSSEQQQIAAFLDYETAKIDRLIAKQERLIDLLKEKRQAVVSHAVTKGLNPDAPMKDSGVEWLGEVPAHWIRSSPSKVCSVISKGTTPSEQSKYQDEKHIIPFLIVENLSFDGALSEEKLVFIPESVHRGFLARSVVVKSFWPRVYRHSSTVSRPHWVSTRRCAYAA